MRYPSFLQKGGTIGFVAPSFGCNTEPYRTAFDNAQRIFTDMGYKLHLGPNCYLGCGIGISNTPEACAKELVDSYVNHSCDVIISCGGGELMCETTGCIDFDKVKEAAPKWFMGYSDNTNFTFPLTVMCDTASIYAPCAGAFGMEPWHDAIKDAFSLICGEKLTFAGYGKWEIESLKNEETPLAPYNPTVDTVLHTYPGGDVHMAGRLLGGCLDCLENLVGTRFDNVHAFNEKYKDDGIIWFLEACDLTTIGIRRTLWHLDNAGWFENVKGFIIGRPMLFNNPFMGLDQYDAVTGILSKYNVPILMDIDLGHLPPALPIINGAIAQIDSIGNDYTISYELR